MDRLEKLDLVNEIHTLAKKSRGYRASLNIWPGPTYYENNNGLLGIIEPRRPRSEHRSPLLCGGLWHPAKDPRIVWPGLELREKDTCSVVQWKNRVYQRSTGSCDVAFLLFPLVYYAYFRHRNAGTIDFVLAGENSTVTWTASFNHISLPYFSDTIYRKVASMEDLSPFIPAEMKLYQDSRPSIYAFILFCAWHLERKRERERDNQLRVPSTEYFDVRWKILYIVRSPTDTTLFHSPPSIRLPPIDCHRWMAYLASKEFRYIANDPSVRFYLRTI